MNTNKIFIDIDALPKTIKHGLECFDYAKFIGLKVNFTYKEITDYFFMNKARTLATLVVR